MSWEIKQAVEEDDWTREYVREVIAHMPTLPPKVQHLGDTRISWFETEPGIAFIRTIGGEIADREFGEILLREQLRSCGIKQAQFTFHRLQKVADWDDIQAKATRLIQSGNVTLLRNGATNIVGHVIGDHGEYQTEISREDPNGDAITQWQCECPWDQFAFQRTRQWKKYEGRPCAHILATYWASRSAPLDEEGEIGMGMGDQGALFDPGTAQPAPKPAAPAPAAPAPTPSQLSIPGVVPPNEPPPGPEIIPPFPGNPVLSPVSIPGGRVPSPLDPTQHPGGTFSKVAAKYPYDAPAFQLHDGRLLIGNEGEYHSETMSRLDINVEDIAQVGDTYGDDVQWHGNWEDYEAEANAAAWDFTAAAGDKFENADMVRLEVEEYGIMEGKSEAHGAGEYKLIPKGSIGEVLGQDPTTGWVDCAFAGPQAGAGPLEPYHVRAWIDPSSLTPMPNVQKPGPFIKRRR